MKKYISFILILLLTVSLASPAFASATPSDSSELTLEDYLQNYEKLPLPADNPGLGVTASDEEWMGDDGNLVASDSDWDFDSWFTDIQSDLNISDSTIMPGSLKPSQVGVHAEVVNSSTGAWIANKPGTYKGATSDGSSLYQFPTLPDGQHYDSLCVSVTGSALPKPGTYGVTWRLRMNNIYWNPTLAYVRAESTSTNVTASSNRVDAKLSKGQFYTGSANVTFGYANNIFYLYFHWPEQLRDLDVVVPVNVVDFTFKENAGAGSVSTPDKESGGTADDFIADQSQQIAQNTADMNDTLKEIVQTISKQLEALWNQMYNYIHLEDMANADKNADKIVNALGNEISVQIENDNRITDEIMENDDKNTDTIVNGYDGSGIDADNDRLNSSLNEYGEAESQVLDKVNDELGNFEFSDSIDSYVSAVSLISAFIQDIYDNSGGFKDVINIGFFLSIASIVIGMYRFKEG